MQIYTVLKIEANCNLSFFVYIRFCDAALPKVGLPKAKTLFSEANFCQGKASSFSFAICYRLISDLTRITYAAISLGMHSSRQTKGCLILQRSTHT